MQPSERVRWHLNAGRIPRAAQLLHMERMARVLGVDEQQLIRDYGLPPKMPQPEVVYLIGTSVPPTDGEPVKIGTTKHVARRLEELQPGSIAKLYLIAWLHGGRDLEREVHTELTDWRIREDWFEMCDAVRAAFRMRIEQKVA